MPRLTPGNVAKWLAVLSLLILGSVLFICLNPGSMGIQTTDKGAQINFSADRRLVVTPDTCITLSWQVENIREVYVNGEGVVGNGEKSLCINRETQPVLRVVFQDDSEKSYPLNIPILVTQPVVWIVVLGAITGLIVAFGLLVGQFVWFRRTVQVVVGTAVALVITLFIVEVGLRAYYTQYGTPHERLLYLASKEEILANPEQPTEEISVPDVNYIPNPAYQTHNSMGYRGPEIELPKPDGVFRIVVMGDSVTYGIATRPEQAYPAQLQQILRDDYGYNQVEVINAGVVGYTSWDVLSNFSFRVLELEPDLVIYLGGTRDALARSRTPDCYLGMNARRGLDPLRQVSIPDIEAPSPSTLYRFLAFNLGWESDPLNIDFNNFDDGLCQTDDGEGPAEHLEANPPIYFRRNLRSMVAIAQANQIEMMLSTEAYYLQTQADLPKTDWWKKGVRESSQIMFEVGSELDVPAYNLLNEIEQNRDFWFDDGIHPNPEGAHEYARLLAAFMVKAELLDGLDE